MRAWLLEKDPRIVRRKALWRAVSSHSGNRSKGLRAVERSAERDRARPRVMRPLQVKKPKRESQRRRRWDQGLRHLTSRLIQPRERHEGVEQVDVRHPAPHVGVVKPSDPLQWLPYLLGWQDRACGQMGLLPGLGGHRGPLLQAIWHHTGGSAQHSTRAPVCAGALMSVPEDPTYTWINTTRAAAISDRTTPDSAPRRSRLLVLDRCTGAVSHRRFGDIVDLLVPGDRLVVNESRVLALCPTPVVEWRCSCYARVPRTRLPGSAWPGRRAKGRRPASWFGASRGSRWSSWGPGGPGAKRVRVEASIPLRRLHRKYVPLPLHPAAGR